MKDEPGLSSARALLIGLEVTTVSFVRDWVELVLENDVRVAAYARPRGLWGGQAWQYPTDLRPLLKYINQTVVDFQLDATSSAELTFDHDNTFVVPLDDEARNGPEAINIVGPFVGDGPRPMWVW